LAQGPFDKLRTGKADARFEPQVPPQAGLRIEASLPSLFSETGKLPG